MGRCGQFYPPWGDENKDSESILQRLDFVMVFT